MKDGGEYEFRLTSYPSLVCVTPAWHALPPGVYRWFEYENFLECELPDWDERANQTWSLEESHEAG